MTKYRLPRHSHLFLVRLWMEDAQDGSGKEVWCGKVQRAIDGESHQFSDWEGLCDLLMSMLTGTETAPSTEKPQR